MNNPTATPIRILFLSHSREEEQSVRTQFEKDGLNAEIQRAENEADFTAALDTSIDLILSDDSQVSLNNKQVRQVLQERRLNIPLILISDAGNQVITEASSQDVEDILTKEDLPRLHFIIRRSLEQKQLREREDRYRGIFEKASVVIWDEDFSALNTELDKLRANGVTDFRQYVQEHPEFIQHALKLVNIVDANEATLKLYKVIEKTEVIGSLDRFVSPENFQEELIAFAEGKAYFEREIRSSNREGALRDLLMTITYYEDSAGRCKALVHLTDVTERKVAEENIRSQNQFLNLLNEMTRAVLLSTDVDSTLQTLAENMAKLIHADDCYIARWDEERQMVIPVAATMHVEGIHPSYLETQPQDLKMSLSVLRVGHVLTADDIYDSPYINVDLARKLQARSALGIPLIAGEHKLGAAVIAFNTPHHFTSEEIDRAEQAGNQIALALWTFQQSLEIQQRLRESHTLAKIERALSESERIGTGEVLQLIVDSAQEIIRGAEKAVIHLLDEEQTLLIPEAVTGAPSTNYKEVKMHLGEGVAGQVISSGETINIADVTTDPRFLKSEAPAKFRSLMVAPVSSGRQKLGTISVHSHATYAFNENDRNLLKALGTQAAIAIENAHLLESTQQALRETDALYRISQGLVSLNTEELLEAAVNLLQTNFGYYHVQMYVIDSDTGNFVLQAGSGEVGKTLKRENYFLRAGSGIVGHTAETLKPFFTNDVDQVVFFIRNPLLPETKSEMAVPVRIGNQLFGILDIQQAPPKTFSPRDLQLVSAMADQLAVVLQKADLYEDLQKSLQQEQTIRSQLIQSERLALVGRLLASVSHELNNPLQAIQNALFLLKEEKNLSSQGSQDLDIILSETERMAALIERLRSAYRPVRMTDFQPVQLNNLIEDVYALIGTHMRHKDIAFEFIPEPNLLPASGISDQLRQVVLNLFLNAIEIMKPGGHLTVETHNLVGQKEVFFSVRDSGPGIEPGILPQIFDAFVTSKQTGTGLGLTITHDILEQHHGRIQAENHPEGGAIFYVWLPVHQQEPV